MRNSKGQFVKGTTSWNKGKKLSEEQKSRLDLSSFKKGHIPWNKGIKCSPETLNKLSESHKGQHSSMKTEFKKGMESWNKGKLHSIETRKKMSEARKGKYGGEKHPNWQGGLSFEDYPMIFNAELREKIRERDNHTCQECGWEEAKLNYKLCVHHIDYNKKNCDPFNLISLCKSCHLKTNYNRENWQTYYREKMEVANA